MTKDDYLLQYPDILLDLLPDDTCCLMLDIIPLNRYYENFSLYELNKQVDGYWCPQVRKEQEKPPYEFDDKFLIGYDSSTSEILFISGNFFRSQVLADFYYRRKSLSDSSMMEYLNLFYFNKNPEKIEVIKHRNAYSKFRIYYPNKSYSIIKLYRTYRSK